MDTLRGQMVFSIKIFVFWSLIGCKIAIFGTIFRLRNWFGDSNANCHFTTEICMFVPSNLYMKSKKVSYNCFFLTFSWKRMEKLKNMYFIYKFIIGCPLLSSHPVQGGKAKLSGSKICWFWANEWFYGSKFKPHMSTQPICID